MKQLKRTLPGWLCWVLGILSIPAMALVVLALQKGSILATLASFNKEPILYVLNLWPIAATLVVALCIGGNLFYSISFTTFLHGVLSYINLIKVNSRGDPFVPGDILLLTEGMEAVGNYELDLQLGKLFALLALCLILIGCGLFFKTPKFRWYFRLGGGVVVLTAFVVTMFTVYPSKTIYEEMKGPNRANVPAVFDSFGFPYCFLHNFNLYPMDQPETYDPAAAARYESDYREGLLPLPAPETRKEGGPNIVMIMCEAFTDLPNYEAFTYSPEDNPVAPFNKLAQDPHSLSGRLVVSNTGAGTANTEFDVLTGCMTNKLSPSTSSAFRIVHRNTDSVPRCLSEIGYNTFFLHPGQNWFYNRESVYSYLGITDQVFRDAFTEADYKGNWLSDQAFLRVLIENLESRAKGAPLFTYAVTIQNHQSYNYNKYGFEPPLPQTDLSLSDEANERLSVYFEGLKDSSNMLYGLTQYLDQKQEPYLLVFFGDHQPNLGSGFQTFEELGFDYLSPDDTQELLQPYDVPFIIWGNDAYCKEYDLKAQAAEVGMKQGDTISSHYLGALTCYLAGVQGVDGYFDYLNEMRQVLPVCSVYGYRLPDGTFLQELPPDLQRLEDLRWNWQYCRLKTQKE